MSHITSIPKKQQKVLIIAGSPDVIKRKRNLDSYDIIIKMNAIPQDPQYDEYISSRCDIWVYTPCVYSKLSQSFIEKRKYSQQYVYFGSTLNILDKRDNAFFETQETLLNNKNSTNIFWDSLKDKYNFYFRNSSKYPSTGFVTIFYFMKFFSNITLLGFTFQEGKPHFYNDQKKSVTHDFKREKALIFKWVKEGKLFFYKDPE